MLIGAANYWQPDSKMQADHENGGKMKTYETFYGGERVWTPIVGGGD